jgi:hypothetical protein
LQDVSLNGAAAEVNRLELAMRALWTASALLMTGQRRAMACRLDIVPPPGLVLDGVIVVVSERRVAAEVRFRNGHMARD